MPILEINNLTKSFGKTEVLKGVSFSMEQGEVVSICDEHGEEFARGMANYNSQECTKIAGAHSDNILEILGYKNYDTVISRDNITNLA